MKEDINYYYSVLYCTEISRQKILALRALNHAFKNIVFKSQPEIIHAQFDFWQNELRQKIPSHPLTKSLQNYFSSEIIFADLSQLLEYYRADALTSLYEKTFDLEKYYQNTGGFFEKLIYQHLLPETQFSPELPEKLGIFISKAEDFFDLRKQILKRKIFLSGESLLKHKTTLYQLSELSIKPHIQALLINEIDNRLNLMPTKTEAIYYPSHILAKIYSARLQIIKKNVNQFFTHHIDITPLKKFLISWRSKPAIKI